MVRRLGGRRHTRSAQARYNVYPTTHDSRQRRRRGLATAIVRLDPIERRKLPGLGYRDPNRPGDKGPAFGAAASAYLSDKLPEEAT
jgi:hypothetical protein